MTIYSDYTNKPIFEGTKEECRKFLLDRAEQLSDGRKLYRRWEENGKYFYDVTNIYYTYEPII